MMAGRVALAAFAALLAAFLVLPVLAVVPAAFSARSFIRLPPEAWSVRWWGTFFGDPSWRRALLKSVEVAVLATLVAVPLGTAAALGLARLRGIVRRLALALFVGPVVVPVIVLAVALYAVARSAGLVGTTAALVLGHAMLALPYVALNVGVSLAALDPALGRAAAGLGASSWRLFRTVTLPLILPGVVGGAVFAFVTSFDEVVLSVFLAGPSAKTLPVRIWEEIRVEYTPVVAVAATFMMALAILAAASFRLLRRRRA
ncbi:MAG: ABC transporter permease [Alphaproteobacteria bacterium]|nr:ABC transporter permease [Alphaproteobacteria bacterium]